jgi:hypothetical protein
VTRAGPCDVAKRARTRCPLVPDIDANRGHVRRRSESRLSGSEWRASRLPSRRSALRGLDTHHPLPMSWQLSERRPVLSHGQREALSCPFRGLTDELSRGSMRVIAGPHSYTRRRTPTDHGSDQHHRPATGLQSTAIEQGTTLPALPARRSGTRHRDGRRRPSQRAARLIPLSVERILLQRK